MIRRTTIEIDQEILQRAKEALGQSTTRGTVEEALRRAAASIDTERSRRAANQRRYLGELNRLVDLDVLGSEQMWR